MKSEVVCCPACDKQFAYRTGLRRHTIRQHRAFFRRDGLVPIADTDYDDVLRSITHSQRNSRQRRRDRCNQSGVLQVPVSDTLQVPTGADGRPSATASAPASASSYGQSEVMNAGRHVLKSTVRSSSDQLSFPLQQGCFDPLPFEAEISVDLMDISTPLNLNSGDHMSVLEAADGNQHNNKTFGTFTQPSSSGPVQDENNFKSFDYSFWDSFLSSTNGFPAAAMSSSATESGVQTEGSTCSETGSQTEARTSCEGGSQTEISSSCDGGSQTEVSRSCDMESQTDQPRHADRSAQANGGLFEMLTRDKLKLLTDIIVSRRDLSAESVVREFVVQRGVRPSPFEEDLLSVIAQVAISAEERVVRQLHDTVYGRQNEGERRAVMLACSAIVHETLKRPQPRW